MRRRTVLSIVLLLVMTAGHPRAAEFAVKAGPPNRVVFTSKAATESFDGKTDRMSGRIVLDPTQVTDSVMVHIEVDLASLDTGIGKRNQHMRENHLETATYPLGVFDGAAVRAPKTSALVAGTPVSFEVEGTFTLHGVSKRLRTTVVVTMKDAKTLEFNTSFKVALADYQISRPKFLFVKLGEVQDVSVSGVATLSP